MSSSQNWIDRGEACITKTYGRYPLVAVKGEGTRLQDAEGKSYLDFLAGVAVNNLGHCHPKVTEAVQRHAATLMNAHDFTTRIKVLLLEKLVEVLPGDLTGIQLYDSGTTAVEAGLRTGDRITALDGEKIVRLKDVLALLAWVPPNEESRELIENRGIRLTLLRDGQTIEATLPGDVFRKLELP